MSRCKPYPYLGYGKKAQVVDLPKNGNKAQVVDLPKNGKKAQVVDLPKNGKNAQVVDLGLMTKKEKHKHKDKKKKKRKDSETNGDAHDKDKRSNKKRRAELAKDVVHMENGRVLDIKAVAATPAAVESPLDRLDRDAAGRPDSERRSDSICCQPALYDKERKANGKVDSVLPIVLLRPPGTSSSTGTGDTAASSSQSFENDNEEVRQRHTLLLPQVEGVWSAVDDQEWLFLQNYHLHSMPKAKLEDGGGTTQVWTEALHLPSVDMYALPYVFPY